MHSVNLLEPVAPARYIVLEDLMAPEKAEALPVPEGASISDLERLLDAKFPAVCQLNGEWLLRAGWGYQPAPGDVVLFAVYPQGGGGGASDPVRIVLTLAAIYAAVQFGQTYALPAALGGQAASQAIALVALTALVNVLVPIQAGARPGDTTQPSASYNVALSGNQARLEQPIPVLYGRNKTFVDFAGEPYTEFSNKNNDDQFFYSVTAIGQGQYNIESVLIDDTSINNFSDVQWEILPPGTQPTLARANVVNAVEVTGQPLTDGRYVGPFIGCRPRSVTSRIGIDITMSRGLATYDAAGVPGNKTVGWAVEYRLVDDFGGGLTEWVQLAAESLTLAQAKPVRRTYFYTIPPGRPQVRVTRTTPFDDNSRVANEIEWAGLRCYLDGGTPLDATTTHMAVAIRASEQMSGLTQRKVAVISRRLVRTWSSGGGWTAPVETRNFAWALADKWTNSVYGDGYPDSRIDLASLALRAAVADARQDRFDGVFDQTFDSFTADQMIAQSGRCAVFRRNGVMTLTRDEVKTLPVTGFNSRSIQPGSVGIDYMFANEATPDGVIIEYWHNRIWDWEEIICPVPGVVTPVRPQRMKLFGVTGPKHAEREGRYQAANALYRRKFASFSTELEGMIPAFGSAAVFSPSLPGWGRGGDVVNFNTSTLVITVTEPIIWAPGATHYMTFIKRNGTLSDPVVVSPGSSEFQAVLSSQPVEPLYIDDADAERTRYLFGSGVPYESILRVLGVKNSSDDKGLRTYTINGVIEDDRVHAADVHLLPAAGEVQDPVDPSTADGGSGGGGGDSGVALRAFLAPQTLRLFETSANFPPGNISAQFKNDGLMSISSQNSAATGVPTAIQPTDATPDMWLLGRIARTPAQAGLFQIRATLLAGDPPLVGNLDVWEGLDTSRTWIVQAVGSPVVVATDILFEVRLAATGIVQASAVFSFNITIEEPQGE